MSLEKIHLTDFQSHADSSLRLAPGVNVIVGTGNAGKTAIVRAIEWIRTNRPTGDGMIRRGQREASAEVVSGGHTITRSRNKSNSYWVDGEKLTAMGMDVPHQVESALGLQDINVQDQFCPHYLVLDSPGKIAREINDVVHLDDAEAASKALSSSLREVAAEEKATQEQVEELARQLKPFGKLDAYEQKVDRAVVLTSTLEIAAANKDRLNRLCKVVEELNGVYLALPDERPAQDILVSLNELVDGLDNVTAQRDRLRKLIDEGKRLVEPTVSTQEVERLEDLAAKAKSDRARLAALQKDADDLDDLITQIESKESALEECHQKLQKAQEDRDRAYNELDVCPTCGQPLDQKTKEQLTQ